MLVMENNDGKHRDYLIRSLLLKPVTNPGTDWVVRES